MQSSIPHLRLIDRWHSRGRAAVNAYAASLFDTITKRTLRVERIVPIHGSVTPYAEVLKTVWPLLRARNLERPLSRCS